MKLLELLSEVLPLAFLLQFFYCSQVAAAVNEDTIKSLNGIDFYNDSDVQHRSTMDSAHPRRKRFIAFPVGSSFSTAVCMTTGVIGNPSTEYLSMGLNWGIAYDLPNSTWVLQHASAFSPADKEVTVSPQIKRRHRRDLYGKLETLINGFFVLKTLIIILVIHGDFVKQKKSLRVAASKTAHVSAINNFTALYLNKNHIIFDPLHTEANDAAYAHDDHLVSASRGNCTRTSNCNRELYDTKIATLTAKNASGKRTNSVKLKPAGHVPSTDAVTKTVSSLWLLSQAESSPTSLPSPSPLLLKRQQHFLSRPKRYLSFPEGSSFSVAVCFTVGIIGNPRYNYMSFGLNWGVAYDLPNTTWILNHLHGFAKQPIPVAVWHRRSRRSLYKEIENVVDNMGYNGRDCILRALCESRQYFQKTKMSMIGEMLRAVFSLPKQRIFTRELIEKTDIELYDRAYRRARSIADCSEQYNCGFSLLELAFGRYSTPPDGYYTQH